MGLISRMSDVVKAKVSQLLDRTEDPRETLDYAYQRQLEHLQDVKRGIVEVATAKRRLELQAANVQQNVSKLDDQARRAILAGRDDLAKLAIQRKQLASTQIQELQRQMKTLEGQQQGLQVTEERLAAKVETFRTQKEMIKAEYSAAEARVKIGESLTGISEEMADVGMAVDRARDKTEALQARAGAIDELVATGTLEEPLAGDETVERELQRLSVTEDVDREVEAMKHELVAAGKSQPRQLKEGK